MKTNGVVKLIFAAIAGMAPRKLKHFIYVSILGYKIDSSAKIGAVLIYCPEGMVVIEAGTRIGHFTVIRRLKNFRMAQGSSIGQWNWITAAPDFYQSGKHPESGKLWVDESATITSRHYIDCSGQVTIGPWSMLAGVKSTIMSHQIDHALNVQTPAVIEIGAYSVIGSDCRLVPGAIVPPYSQIAMGSVVVGKLDSPGFLWAGVPAQRKHKVDGEWYRRNSRRVSV